MMIGTTIYRDAPQGWDIAVASTPCGGLFQTTDWANLLRALRGAEPLYVTVDEDGRAVARCLIIKQGLFSDVLRRSQRLQFLLPVVHRALATFSWLHGPTLHAGQEAETAVAIYDAIERLARKEGVMSIDFTSHPTMQVRGLEPLLVDRGYEARTVATYLVDLQTDYVAKMHRSVGKNARKCLREGVEIVVVQEEDLPQYYRLVSDFRQASGMQGFSMEHFLMHQKVLGECRRLFAARFEGQFIAGLGVLAYNGLLIECEAATSSVCFERKLFANDLIKLEIMDWGKAQGFRLFDLAGVAVKPKDEKAAGIRKFKKKFGGYYVEYTSFNKRVGRLRGSAVAWAQKVARAGK